MKTLVVLTGAGMSADSGLATFRDSGGLWEGYDIEDVASLAGWKNDPERVLDFYNRRRSQAANAFPNKGHITLARLEDYFDVQIITQNVDDLHEKAGSGSVLHLHGKLREARSTKNPDNVIDIGIREIQIGDKAEDGGQLRPNVVWFGEPVPNIEPAAQIVSNADIFVIIGTSLVVYPAAGLIDYSQQVIPKFIIDPADLGMSIGSGWTHIKKTAEEGVPELKKILIEKYLDNE